MPSAPSSFEHTEGYVFDGKRLILCGNSRSYTFKKQLLIYDYEEDSWTDFTNTTNAPSEGYSTLYSESSEKTYVLDMSLKLKTLEFKKITGASINMNTTSNKWFFIR